MCNNGDQRAEAREFLTEEEAVLATGWSGLNPLQVAEKMRREYLRIFPGGVPSEIDLGGIVFSSPGLRSTLESPKENTWLELDGAIIKVSRTVHSNHAALDFWDSMREICFFLRDQSDEYQRIRRQVDRASKNKDWYEARPITSMKVCRLCWRVVPVRKGMVPSQFLCHIHMSNSSDPKFRSKIGIKNKYFELINRIYRQTKQYFTIYKDDVPQSELHDLELSCCESGKRVNWEHIWLKHPEFILESLPHVYEKIKKQNIEITSARAIIDALEGPVPSEPDDAKNAREQQYLDFEYYFWIYLDWLAWAEAWLTIKKKLKKKVIALEW